ncbi:MAG: hypothetical protein ACI87E_003873 [Mariniblastus sp.]|jgi:hypothetical protein
MNVSLSERCASVSQVFRLMESPDEMVARCGSEDEPSLATCRQGPSAHAYKRSAFDTVAWWLIVKRSIVFHFKSTKRYPSSYRECRLLPIRRVTLMRSVP